MDSGNHC
jgi:hypothetical protein